MAKEVRFGRKKTPFEKTIPDTDLDKKGCFEIISTREKVFLLNTVTGETWAYVSGDTSGNISGWKKQEQIDFPNIP